MGSGGGRRVGVDTGGTFTDVVDESGAHVKVLSDRVDPASAVRRGLADVGAEVEVLAHGTTVATNTLLERVGEPRRPGDERGLRGPHRDRSSGSTFVVRPMGRPSGAARPACMALRRSRSSRRRRHRARASRCHPALDAPSRDRDRRRLSPARRPLARARESSRRGARSDGPRRGRVTRHFARASRVRATRDHGRQRLRATGVQQLPRPPCRGRPDGARHDLGRRPRAARAGGGPARVVAALRTRRGRQLRPRPSRPPTDTRTR